jgi:hypothetical protein
VRSFVVLIVMVLSGLYLLNPSFGLFEFIPDNFPLVGNLDEASAVLVFVACLRYFGVDLTRLFERRPDEGHGTGAPGSPSPTPRTLPRRDTAPADDRRLDGR